MMRGMGIRKKKEMLLDPRGSRQYLCIAGRTRQPPSSPGTPLRCPSPRGALPSRDAVVRVSSSSPFEVLLQAFPLAGGPLLCLLSVACGPDEQEILSSLKNCEPSPEALAYVWEGDRRAPCGERWLIENAPEFPAPSTPLGQARQTLRGLRNQESIPASRSLSLRPWGVPRDVFEVYLEILAEQDTPVGFEDPWLRGRLSSRRDDRRKAAHWVGALAWHPDEQLRQSYLDELGLTFDMDMGCSDPECLWAYADTLAGEAGAPGDRSSLSDPVWLRQTGSPRLAGLAGAWLEDWREWSSETEVVRPGVGKEPAAALWIGGTESANRALRADLLRKPLLNPQNSSTPVEGPGALAAAVVPW